MPPAEVDKTSRAHFEDRVFAQYFMSNVYKRDGDGMAFGVRNMEDMETFTRKDEEGNYVREDVSAMWFGWNLFAKENGYNVSQ